jgi:hypothetical protein
VGEHQRAKYEDQTDNSENESHHKPGCQSAQADTLGFRRYTRQTDWAHRFSASRGR